MNKGSRVLLICASAVFGLCCLGLLTGLIYNLVEYSRKTQAFDQILANSIPFYKLIGALGIVGFVLFFLFLLSLLSLPAKRDRP
jgi:hypothetical protein